MGETTNLNWLAGFLTSTVGPPKLMMSIYVAIIFPFGVPFEVPAVSFLGCNCVTTGGKRNLSSPSL